MNMVIKLPGMCALRLRNLIRVVGVYKQATAA